MKSIIRIFWLCATFLSAIPFGAFAANLDEELNLLEEKRYEAIVGADWPSLDALLGDEFFYNTAAGASLTKSAFLDYMKSGAVKVRKAVRDQAQVRPYGDIVLVTGVAHIDVTVKGEDKVIHSRYLHVWSKDGQGWKLVARQATYLPDQK